VSLKAGLDAGRLQIAVMTDISEVERYDVLRRTLGDGEAASLALAECRGWFIACDEKRRFRREAEARIGADRILNTVSLLVLAILEGLVTVEEADVLKERLAERRFHGVASFADLLPPIRS
jgi:predicted nucleic acid-binding protein